MATLTDTHPTLLDVSKRLDPNGKVDKIVEILAQTNEILADAVYIEDVTPEKFTGFAARYSSLSAENGQNINASAADGSNSTNTSIWFIGWGPNSCFMTYPKGSVAGLKTDDKGQITIENVDGAGGRMEAYRTHYRMDAGLVLKDWRYVYRIQVDFAELTKDASTGADLIDLMTDVASFIPNLTGIRGAFYCSRRVHSFLRRQMVNKVKNSTLMMSDVAGQSVMTFDGFPVRRVDSLLHTEAKVAA